MVYGYGQAGRMNLRAFILRLREDWICWSVVISSFSDSLIFQSCRFLFKIFLSGDFEK